MTPVDLPENPAHAIDREAASLARQGRDILRLHIGDPDLETPVGVREAAERSLRNGRTHYAPAQGYARLRSAIVTHWAEGHGVEATAEQVVVLPAKFAIFATLAATIEPGDEVLFADPSYFFEEPTRLLRGVPRRFPLRADHSLDLEALVAGITERTRVLALVNPGNPTGRRLRKDELTAAAGIAHDHHLTVLSDEAYSELVYDGRHTSLASVAPPELPVVSIGSFSKTFAMSGWRAGFAIGPPELVRRLVQVVEHTLTCLPPFVQDACRWALEEGRPDAERIRAALQERRDHLLGRLDDLPGIDCVPPDGAIYAFPRYHLELPSVDLAQLLLREEGVAVAPGAAFGPAGEGHFRIAFSLAPDRLDVAADRLRAFLERHGASRG